MNILPNWSSSLLSLLLLLLLLLSPCSPSNLPRNKGRSSHSSAITHPQDQQSDAGPYSTAPKSNSGARYLCVSHAYVRIIN
jgi:hypothetical protein